MPYALPLTLHSLLRWVILALFVVVIARAARGSRRAAEWSPLDERLHVGLVATVDIQLLLGLWLYVLASPITRAFYADPAHGMRVTTLRFFGVEHLLSMLIALALVHVGRARSKRAESPALRHRRVLKWTLGALVAVVIGIPWPMLRYGRPLARIELTEPRSVSGDVYGARCAVCHGASGRGDGIAARGLTPPPRDLTDAAWQRTRTDEELGAIIREGGAPHELSAAMPPHSDLSDEDLAALVASVRSLASDRSRE